MSEVSDPQLVGRLRAANARLRELLTVRDAEFEALRSEAEPETAELREALRLLTLRVAELERQLRSGSDDSGTPTSKEPIAAKARRKAERKARRDTDTSSRERSADRSRGGQPGHPGHGLVRDPALRMRVYEVSRGRSCRVVASGNGV